MADLSTWSTTAASNNSTPPDGWPEGQNPSTVNDCAREMMAQVATWRQKFGGWIMENVGIAAAVASNDLTVSLKVKDGTTNPSATNKVGIGFRSATLTSGAFEFVQATAATSVVLPGGGSMGANNSQTIDIHVFAINNAGTIELAIAGRQNFDEGSVHSTTAIGTGSDSAGVLYSTSARSNVPIRYIGRITVQYGTAAWTNSPTIITAWGPGINNYSGSYTATATGMTTSPTGTVYYVVNGNVVTLQIPTITGTSNAATFTLTGAPVAIRPSVTSGQHATFATDSGSFFPAIVSMNSSGTLTYSAAAASTPIISSAGFTASGTKGSATSTISYMLNLPA